MNTRFIPPGLCGPPIWTLPLLPSAVAVRTTDPERFSSRQGNLTLASQDISPDRSVYDGFLFPQRLPYPCTHSFSGTPFRSRTKDWCCCLLRCTEDITVQEKLTKDKSNTTDFAGHTFVMWHKRTGSVFLYETRRGVPLFKGRTEIRKTKIRHAFSFIIFSQGSADMIMFIALHII